MRLLIELFLTFFKIGLFTFGGGYGMIALIENACVEEKKWITHDELMNILVIAESTPGPIAINCATYVGYKQKGFWGSVSTTFGVVLPSIIIIYLIALYFKSFLEVKLIAKAFEGINLAVGILIIDAALNMYNKMKEKTFLTSAILIVNFLLMLIISIYDVRLSTIILMLSSGLITLVVFSIKQLFNKRVGETK